MAIGSFVTMLDISMVGVAMPQMLGTFGVSLDAITWVAVAYSIAEIILVTMAAWCSVLLGRKRFYLLALARLVGGNIGYAFVASQVSYRTAVHGATLVDELTPREGETMRLLEGLHGYLVSAGLLPGMAEDGALHLLDGAVQRQATMLAHNDVFAIMGLLFLLALPFLGLLGGRSRRPVPPALVPKLHVDTALLKKYDVPGPRYTSYPPAPVFSDAFGWQEYVHAVQASNEEKRPLSLYVHLPFCRSLCWYCGCNRIITHNRARITAYLEYVQREIGLLGTYLSGDRVVVQLHWGGGSPSYLSREDKLALMRGLRQHFEIAAEAEMGIELDPRDVRPGDAEALRTAGFNRVSFGVQDFDPEVQQAVHRVHAEELILGVFAQLRQAGFTSINVDLIYGLPRQSLATFTDTIAKTIRMHPDRIALFNFAYLPTLFKHQRLLNAAELPVPDEKLRMLKMAIETLTAHGYVYIGMDHFATPEDDLCRAQRNGTLYRNFQGYSTRAGCDLLAFGCSAIGQVADVYAQNHKALRAYCAAIDAGIPATARGYHLLRDDQIRRDVIQQLMCHLALEKARVEAQWQIDFDGYFAAELEVLKPLEADGLVQITAAGVLVTQTGRLLLRNIAMVFDRYAQAPRPSRPLYSRTV
jgi:oxygen-independent coproporphyrinogen-3 oxidase